MELLRSSLMTLLIVIASFTANAASITSGGVTWDPEFDNGFNSDFVALGSFNQYYVAGSARNGIEVGDIITDVSLAAVNDTLEGFGYIANLNGSNPSSYCLTCDVLSFTFTGFQVENLNNLSAPTFSGGSAAIYANDGGIPTSYASASDDLLWLDLAPSTSRGSTLVGNEIFGSDYASAYFNVVGGVAESYFDQGGQVGGSDLVYNSSRALGESVGSFIVNGGTSEIPEPTSFAIFALGLLGLVVRARRKA